MADRTVIWLLLALALGGAIAFPILRERQRKPMDAAARKTAPGHFAALSQGVTHYNWIGPERGPIAVCVHGLTTPSFVWQDLAREMASMGYRVLTYDLYGRGYSDRAPGKQDRAFFLQQLNDLLSDQKIAGHITLIGYSMGGAIATLFAAAHPDLIRQLVLLAPAGMGTGANAMTRFIVRTPVIGDWLTLALFPSRHRQGTEAERALYGSAGDIIDLQQAELEYQGFVPAVLSSMRGVLAADLETEHRSLYRASIPVLTIWGREDTIVPLSAMGKLAQWNRTARQEGIDSAGHGLTYTHTDQVVDILRPTLRDGLN